MKDIIDQLKWRYAVKKFDSSKKLTEEQLNKLKSALNLTASSLGLQPYKIMIISDEETKKKLFPHAYNQAQVITASHIFLFCAIQTIDDQFADNYIQYAAKVHGVEVEILADYANMVKGFVSGYDEQQKLNWASKQAYIALGNLLTTCALEEIDSCPMEGFIVPEFSKVLGLEAKGLLPLVMCPVGYRSEEDQAQHRKKVRKTDLFDI